jgi:hypothetical protein
MDWWNKLPSRDKQVAVLSALGIGAVVIYMTANAPSPHPALPVPKNAVARTEAQKSGFPAQENLPDYQPAVESNSGETPSYSTNSAFGK